MVEIQIHLVPVLLGEGKLLFDHLGNRRIDLERTRVVEAPEGVTHLSSASRGSYRRGARKGP